MKKPFPLIVACTLLVLTATGCDKTQMPQPEIKVNSPSISVPTVPDMPDPKVPKKAEALSPQPGQANDHSSPTFKDGGVVDPKK